jgi:hypothetical protein
MDGTTIHLMDGEDGTAVMALTDIMIDTTLILITTILPRRK